MHKVYNEIIKVKWLLYKWLHVKLFESIIVIILQKKASKVKEERKYYEKTIIKELGGKGIAVN